MMDNDTAIKITNLSKVYPLRHPRKNEAGESVHEHWALKTVSFDIKKGESVGIIGPNGSGKSTLLKILAGVTKPTTGKVEIRGKVASILDVGAGFHPELSGRENIHLNGQIHGFSKKEIENKFDEIIEFSGIGEFIEEPVKNYSNGMYLRLAFSIMANLNFDVYLFDEVMNVGDADFKKKSEDKFEELLNKKDKTIIHVSHQLNDLSNNDLFVLLRNGHLIKATSDASLLCEYIEQGYVETKGMIIYDKPFLLKDFSTFSHFEDVELISLELYQESITIVSNKDIWIKISYEKLLNENTLDVVLVISDFNDNVVFSSSPIANGIINSSREKIRNEVSCKIPSDIFVSAIYKISIRFLKNIDFVIKSNLQDIKHHINPTFKNVAIFKPEYKNSDTNIDLQKINSKYSLFMKTDWTQKNCNND